MEREPGAVSLCSPDLDNKLQTLVGPLGSDSLFCKHTVWCFCLLKQLQNPDTIHLSHFPRRKPSPLQSRAPPVTDSCRSAFWRQSGSFRIVCWFEWEGPHGLLYLNPQFGTVSEELRGVVAGGVSLKVGLGFSISYCCLEIISPWCKFSIMAPAPCLPVCCCSVCHNGHGLTIWNHKPQ